MVKMYKITLYIIDLGNDFKNSDEVLESLDTNKYVHIFKGKGEDVDIGEWEDEHILNNINTPIEKFKEYFNK